MPGNPDMAPSLGFSMKQMNVSGDRAEVDLPGDELQRIGTGHETREMTTIGTDLKLPVHPSITLFLSYDLLNGEEIFKRQESTYRESVVLDGYQYGFGIRLYFNK